MMKIEFLEDSFSYNLRDDKIEDIRVKEYEKSNYKYKIFNYDYNKKIDDLDMTESYYRSVIKNNDNKLICFSLPKSKSYDFFKENNVLHDDNVTVTEIIEGTMINLFYNYDLENWDISTKSAIGGDYFFYRNDYKTNNKSKQLTFRQMFMEALRFDKDSDFKTNTEFFNNFDKDFCYSFVLQHPENHIVLDIEQPKLFLIGAFRIKEDSIKFVDFITFRDQYFLKEIIYYPRVYEKEKDYEEMETKYTMDKNNLIMGLMYYNKKTGTRSHNRHEKYENMRLLRGNNPNLQYQYLCLKKIGKVKEFLEYFPKYQELFYGFFNKYKNFLTNIHKSYLEYYIKKNKDSVSKKYMFHINKLHFEVYIPSLNTEEHKIINKTEIFKYFESYDPIQQLYYLNYDDKNM